MNVVYELVTWRLKLVLKKMASKCRRENQRSLRPFQDYDVMSISTLLLSLNIRFVQKITETRIFVCVCVCAFYVGNLQNNQRCFLCEHQLLYHGNSLHSRLLTFSPAGADLLVIIVVTITIVYAVLVNCGWLYMMYTGCVEQHICTL